MSSMPPDTISSQLDGYTVLVSLPPAYGNGANRYDVLYILEEPGQSLFAPATSGVRDRHATISKISGRGWYPDMIVVSAIPSQPATAEEMLRFCTSRLIGFVQQAYSTKPFAGGRSICAYSSDAATPSAAQRALADPETASLFRFYLLGLPTASVEGAPLLEKTAVYLGVGRDAGDAPIAAAEKAKAILDSRLTIDIIEPGSLSGADAFADRSVGWLGAQLEKQKQGSLASLFPWHEFR